MYKNDKKLTLNEETFSSLKQDFDSVLNRTIGNMEMKGADEATVTLKLSIKLDKTTTYTETGALDVTRPSFKHDVSSVMQVKDKKSGQLNGEMALVFDSESGSYILRPITNGQMSFDTDGSVYDGNGQVIIDAEVRSVEEDGNAIEGREILGIGVANDYKPEDDLEYDGPVVETTEGDEETAGDEIEEPLPFTEDDEEEPAGDEIDTQEMTRFEWLRQYIGEKMVVTENMGNYAVRLENNGSLVLSTAVSQENPAFVPKEKLENLVGKVLVCVRYVIKDKTVSVAVEREDDNTAVIEVDAPEE